MSSQMHDGTTISELYARVDNVLALSESGRRMWTSSINPDGGLSSEHDPWSVIVNARLHLTNHIMDEGDVLSWWDLGKYQDCFLEGKTTECRHCGEMEGLHSLKVYCRDQRDRGIFSNAMVSYRFETKAEEYR